MRLKTKQFKHWQFLAKKHYRNQPPPPPKKKQKNIDLLQIPHQPHQIQRIFTKFLQNLALRNTCKASNPLVPPAISKAVAVDPSIKAQKTL